MKKVLFIVLGLLALFPLYFLVVSYVYPGMLERGQFGDMFGGLNALFSGLAFLGVIYAILLQRRELELQREELKLTRKELNRTAKAQELSQQELSKQAASLKATAKLNGLSALLQRYSSLRSDALSRGTFHSRQEAKEWDLKAQDVTSLIEQTIELK